MKKGINGISPIIAAILTLLIATMTVLVIRAGRLLWGVVLAVITGDFCADLILALRKREKQ